jgi:hypothetical protein
MTDRTNRAPTKADRIRSLVARLPSTPRTYWELDAFLAARRPDSERWYLRGEDLKGLPTTPLTSRDAEATWASWSAEAEVELVLQEYLEPGISGVACIADTGQWFVEAMEGPCYGLLREGQRGSRIAVDSARNVLWDDDWRGFSPEWSAVIPELRAGFDIAAQPGTLVEWIVTSGGQFYFVDLRLMPAPFVAVTLDERPTTFVIGVANGEAPRLRLKRTSLDLLGEVLRAREGPILFENGSPLSHLVVAAVDRGLSCIVEYPR